MTAQQIRILLVRAIENLLAAENAMLAPTVPHTRMGRYKTYVWLYPSIVWPYRPAAGSPPYQGYVSVKGQATSYKDSYYRGKLIDDILKQCDWQPKKLVKVIYRIDANARWCSERGQGRKRAAAEIMKQQSKAVTVLEEMIALDALGKIGRH